VINIQNRKKANEHTGRILNWVYFKFTAEVQMADHESLYYFFYKNLSFILLQYWGLNSGLCTWLCHLSHASSPKNLFLNVQWTPRQHFILAIDYKRCDARSPDV
jgi:hypothetical protein